MADRASVSASNARPARALTLPSAWSGLRAYLTWPGAFRFLAIIAVAVPFVATLSLLLLSGAGLVAVAAIAVGAITCAAALLAPRSKRRVLLYIIAFAYAIRCATAVFVYAWSL